MGGYVFEIVCEKVIKEELDYRKQDYIDLLEEILKQRDEEYKVSVKYYQQLEGLKLFLEKEVDINKGKFNQADWLPSNKKKFIEGELNGFKKALELITNSNATLWQKVINAADISFEK